MEEGTSRLLFEDVVYTIIPSEELSLEQERDVSDIDL